MRLPPAVAGDLSHQAVSRTLLEDRAVLCCFERRGAVPTPGRGASTP